MNKNTKNLESNRHRIGHTHCYSKRNNCDGVEYCIYFRKANSYRIESG